MANLDLNIEKDREYEIKLGESFLGEAGDRVAYHGFYYHFVPQSLDFSQTGEIRTTPDARSGAIEMDIKNKNGDIGAIMSGQRNASKDYALIFNGKEFWIEKVSSSANLQMKEEPKKKTGTQPRGKGPAATAQVQQQPEAPPPAPPAPPAKPIRIQLPQPGQVSAVAEPPLTPGGSSRRTRTSQAAASSTSAAAAAASYTLHDSMDDNPFPSDDLPQRLPFVTAQVDSLPFDDDVESSSDSDSDSE
eukprot:TRINITY_DN13732_c0_g1_i1.p1 TRINITY_DN13732_c0_g1~~TRINITY_DN13732_c0_g1_i1.p1  ORF type:complete len:246 (+),score=53.46 TRINITY_DN13732_c0_g1_i1:55-792(+)